MLPRTMVAFCWTRNCAPYLLGTREAWGKVPHLATAEYYPLQRVFYCERHSSPIQFMLTLLALLSCYRILDQRQPFAPTSRSESYLTGLQELERGGSIENAVILLEHVAYLAIKIDRTLGLPLLNISYLRPHQPDSYVEQTPQTVPLDVYCSARLFKPTHMQRQ